MLPRIVVLNQLILTVGGCLFETDLNRRHKQLSDWVRRGIVPNPNSEPLIGRGQLTSVWLGGLANPGALMTSLRHEKAAMVGCSVDEVGLKRAHKILLRIVFRL